MKNLIPILFLIVFLGILAGGNIYISRRLAWFTGIENNRMFYVVFAAVSVYMIAGLIAFTNSTSIHGHLMYWTAAVIMGIILYLLLSFLAVHLVQVIMHLCRASI